MPRTPALLFAATLTASAAQAQVGTPTPTVAAVACQTAVAEKVRVENPGTDDVMVDFDRVQESRPTPTEVRVEGPGQAVMDESVGFLFSCTYDLTAGQVTRVDYTLGAGGYAAPGEDDDEPVGAFTGPPFLTRR